MIEEYAICEGQVGVHQFSRIGTHAIRGGGREGRAGRAAVLDGGRQRSRAAGGRQRYRPAAARLQPETIAALKSAIRTLFFSKLLREEAIAKTLEEYGDLAEVRRLVDFINNSKRGVVGRERE